MMTRQNRRSRTIQRAKRSALTGEPVRFEHLEPRTLMSLLGVTPSFPFLDYNSGGRMSFNASTGAISVDATPLSFQLNSTVEFPPVIDAGDFLINFSVDGTGAITAGAAGHDLNISGNLDLDEDGFYDYSGTLLTGEIDSFGFHDGGGTVADQFDFWFQPTGGALAPFYAGSDLGISLTGENIAGLPGFQHFAQNFTVVAKGFVGAIAPRPTTASLGDFVWNDQNSDGVQQSSEPGVQGVRVTLTNAGSDLTFGTTDDTQAVQFTDGTGHYLFVNLVPGLYNVTFDMLPAGFSFTSSNIGLNDALDSDANPLNGITQAVNLIAGQNDLSLDAGIRTSTLPGGQGRIGNFVFNDINHNGVQDSGEGGVEFAFVELLDSAFNVINSTTTGVDGAYLFTGLNPDTYFVRFTPPTGYSFTNTDLGLDDLLDSDADITTGLTPAIPLALGEINLSVDAGMFSTVTPVNADINIEKFVRVADEQTGGAEGLTPGYWKQAHHFDDWAIYLPTDNYNTVFGVSDNPLMTLLDALNRGGGGIGALGRHAVAALLNSTHENVFYAFTTYQVITAVQGAYASPATIEGIKNQFAAQNELGADLSDGGGGPAIFDPGDIGIDADEAPGLLVSPGDTLAFTYTLMTTGDTAIANISLLDNNATPGDTGDDFAPTPVIVGGFNFGDTDQDNQLDPNEMWFFTSSTPAGSEGQHTNTASAIGTPVDDAGMPVADDVADSDPANWFVQGAPVAPSSISGFVFDDTDNDGQIDLNENAIAGVLITLSGTDNQNNLVLQTTSTNGAGQYAFLNLKPGKYSVSETQPAGFLDGIDSLGSAGGLLGNDVFSNIDIIAGTDAINYNFGEHAAADTALGAGQTATIGYWQNKNGQNLIKSLNGSSTSTALGNWLATTLPKLYGAQAGLNNLAGKTNSDIASRFKTLFKQTGVKLDAQVLATAFAVYVTDTDLAGNTAASYGFKVSSGGTGAATFNVGLSGAAFGVLNNSTLTVLQILQATNNQAVSGVLYGGNSILRGLANTIFTAINETGDIV